MKPYIITMCIMQVTSPAMVDYFEHDMHSDVFNIIDNTVIGDDAWLDFSQVNIAASSYIQNNGFISGDIFIGEGLDVYFKNSGHIDGEIQLGPNAHLTQIITSNQNITAINVDGNYDIVIYKANNLQWSDMQQISATADKIVLVDSQIIMSPETIFRMRGIPVPIELIGSNNLYIKLENFDFNTPVLWRVTGNGTLHLHADNISPLYALQSVIRNGDLYADLIRETDYFKILGTETGNFLNSIRTINPNDNLLLKLDRATDMSQLYNIMNKSMRLNTGRLARPVQTFNRHIDILRLSNDMSQPFYFAPFGVLGNNISAYGLRVGININATNTTQISVAANAANMTFSDGIDDYSANLVGGDITFRYNDKHIFADLNTTFTAAQMITPALQYGAAMTNNPTGLAGAVRLDLGPRFSFGNNFSITPTIGMVAEYASVLRSDSGLSARGGLSARFIHQTGDLKYIYQARFVANNRNAIQASAHLSMAAPDDDVTVSGGIGLLQDEMGMSYNISASIVFNF
ncbi:MAG: autotransporter domain-containing protein [Alphaproteobacteria bacterium]|nr:autotransporter domain-containing protein [Alphaproteobacteria bacterium]